MNKRWHKRKPSKINSDDVTTLKKKQKVLINDEHEPENMLQRLHTSFYFIIVQAIMEP